MLQTLTRTQTLTLGIDTGGASADFTACSHDALFDQRQNMPVGLLHRVENNQTSRFNRVETLQQEL